MRHAAAAARQRSIRGARPRHHERRVAPAAGTAPCIQAPPTSRCPAGCQAVSFHLYPGVGHSSCPQEMGDVRRFVLDLLPELPPPQRSRSDLEAMTGKELKQFLEGRGVSARGLFEKTELLEKALSLL
jgi:hypothetical protein